MGNQKVVSLRLHYQKDVRKGVFMKRIGIIAAMDEEFNILADNLEDVSETESFGYSFFEGTINNCEIVICKCGVGKVNASMVDTILITQYECNLIINTGIAGVIGLKTTEVVVGEYLSYHDVDVRAFGYEYGQIPGMPKKFIPSIDTVVLIKGALNKLNISYKYVPIFSGDAFVTSKEQLSNVTLPKECAVEMEGAAIAHVCVRSGVDFIVLRYISDCVGEENQVKDYMAFEYEMAQRSAKICLQILNNI